MARAHVGTQEGDVLRVGVTQTLHELGGLPESDSRVVQSTRRVEVRIDAGTRVIVGRAHVVVGRIALHGSIRDRAGVGVAPFLPLTDREWK